MKELKQDRPHRPTLTGGEDMAKIKGITIEIGGNTQPLNKALSDVNKKSKDLQSELRQVDKLLKLDPKNTELLAQKQKLLAEAAQNSKEKLDRLKTAQQQVNEQFARGEISEEQYRAFQREVAKAEQELKGFEKQLNETAKATDTWKNKLDKAQTSLKNVGAKMTDVGKNLSMKVTAPVLGLGAAVAKTGMEFDAAMSEVGAISGATGEDLQKLEALAKEMGATTKFSASEAAEGLKYMAMAGWETQQQIDALPGVLMLAAASGEELGAVSDIVTDAMTAFGMEAAQAGEFADVLAAASSNANTNVGMLGESFKYVAPVAGALGFSAQDTAHALGLMANAGIKSSQAGTALRTMMTNLAKPTVKMEKAMAEYGISLTDVNGNMKSLDQVMDNLRESLGGLTEAEQASAAATIFGKEAMSGALAIVNTSEADYRKLAGAINDSAGAAERMSKEMQDNLQGRLTELKSAIEGAALQLYEAMLPALEKLVAWVQKAVDWFAELSPGMKKAIVIVAGLAAAIGPLLILLGTLSIAIGAISLPVAAVIAGIAALGAAIVGIYKLWKENGEKSKKLLGEFADYAKTTWDNIKQKFEDAWNNIKDFFKKWGDEILLIAVGPAGWVVLLGRKIAENWDSIKAKTSEVWNNIKTAITSPIESAKNTIMNIITTIKNAFANMRIEIPKPKLPHISVSTKYKSVGDIRIPYPDFDLNWYKSGGIFDRPSIIGVGEAGTEVVIPLDKMPGLIADALRQAMGGSHVATSEGVLITGNTFYVRNDNDIKLVARELYNLQQTNARGRGLR